MVPAARMWPAGLHGHLTHGTRCWTTRGLPTHEIRKKCHPCPHGVFAQWACSRTQELFCLKWVYRGYLGVLSRLSV